MEQQALDLVDPTKARTRGITAVSAVALWFKVREYTLAQELACAILPDPQIPPFAREELQMILSRVAQEQGLS